ncbi:MAG TPA: chemotaxis protein CheX [Clostridia bacterium]|nr:chemotaxis protein CheX [Clostridia bacterium]
MDERLYNPFCISTLDIIKEMSDIDISGMDSLKEEAHELTSMGISSIITFAGAKKGRLLIDMEPSLALSLAGTILGEEYDDIKDPMVLSLISEVNNIISGNAVTGLNDDFLMDLRLAPPVVFAGSDVVISIPKLRSFSSHGKTDFGMIRINIAWEGGSS